MKQAIDLTEIFAKNLKMVMGDRWSQSSLHRESKVPQTTIGLYLNPERRGGPTPKGKTPGPTMTHLVKLATALEVQPWELLHPDLERARREQEMYAKIEANFAITKASSTPPLFPPSPPPDGSPKGSSPGKGRKA